MRRSRVAVLAVALVAVAAAGCGEGSDLVVGGSAPPTPYSGPLHVPYRKAEVKGDAEPGPKEMMVAAGAAGKALECDGTIYAGGGGERWSKHDGGGTPEEGLALQFIIDGTDPPGYSFRVEREGGGRVLYSYDVKGRTKHAVVVAENQPHRPGWGPETTAQCDPAEFPASVTRSMGLEIWTDATGGRVPVTSVQSSEGARHCDWQEAHFLTLGESAAGGDGRTYARDPHGVLPAGMLTSPYDGHTALPRGTRDTGYRFGDWHLWTVPGDASKLYVRTGDGVELWPAVRRGGGCD
jgi:hypothetical protein